MLFAVQDAGLVCGLVAVSFAIFAGFLAFAVFACDDETLSACEHRKADGPEDQRDYGWSQDDGIPSLDMMDQLDYF